MSVTYRDICHQVGGALRRTAGIKQVQVLEEITEGVPETPLLQVYIQDSEVDVQAETERTTFGAGVRQTLVTVQVDGYARQRSHVGQDMGAQVAMMDAIDDVLSGEVDKPYFGLQGIQAFHWRLERVTFQFGDQTPGGAYAGVMGEISIYVY